MIAGDGRVQRGLGGPAGLGELQLPRADDASVRLDVSALFPAGLNLFGSRVAMDAVYVNTNGTLSFGAPFPAYPTAAGLPPGSALVAPFWADVDTRLRGEGVESGLVHVDLDPVGRVFSVTWDGVGAYRRDTRAPNRFQVQIIDRGGGDADIVLRYETIGWTIGTAPDDAGAQALLAAPGLAAPLALLPGAGHATLADLDVLPGNTGLPGLWVFALRGGVLGTVPAGSGLRVNGGPGPDRLIGSDFGDTLSGLGGDDRIDGGPGDDVLSGGEGSDTLIGGPGNDLIYGGPAEADLRDLIFGGDGNDTAYGGAGNDEIHGGNGDDLIFGDAGSDTLIGNAGADTLSGGALADVLFGGPGDDFLNGGFGFDRLNGGPGADRFFHLGIADHGTDWVQDYSRAEGDRLVFGGPATARAADFLVQRAVTPNAGRADVAEAFVTYRPTGQVLWALVDGAAQPAITVQVGAQVFDIA